MRRIWAILGSAIFAVIAPGMVAGVVPWWISRWSFRAPLFGLWVLRVVGGLLIVAALPVLLDSFARFAIQGLGTPAPVFPTRHLVITGLYRHVRNPMYIAVVGLVLGQGLLFGDTRLLWYGVALGAAFHLFVLGYEEPALRRTFGPEYATFCANVRRWIPRLPPWTTGGK